MPPASASEEERAGLGARACGASEEELLRAQYRVLGDIGEGGFSEVKLAQHLVTHTLVAVKIIPKATNSQLIHTEIDLLSSVQHPNVIKLYEVVDTADAVCLVLEHAEGGDLLDLMQTVGCLWEDEARGVFRQVVRAVSHCHELGIVHGDLKPQNVLLDADGNAKLCDFGLGARVRAGQKLLAAGGTLPFCAPELLRPGGYDGPKADVWSLGVLLYAAVVGRCPFRGDTPAQVEMAMLGGELGFPAHVSSHFRDLLGAMVAADPARRPSLGRVLEHPWLQQGPREPPAPPGLPPRPDGSILEAMAALGYDPQQVREALSAKSYNGLMGAYLMLEQRKSERGERGGLARSPRPSVAPGGPWSSRVPSAGASAPALQPPPFPGKDAPGSARTLYLAPSIRLLPRASPPRPAPAPGALRDAEDGGRHEGPAAPPASAPAAWSGRLRSRLRSCLAWLRGLCSCVRCARPRRRRQVVPVEREDRGGQAGKQVGARGAGRHPGPLPAPPPRALPRPPLCRAWRLRVPGGGAGRCPWEQTLRRTEAPTQAPP
ncbi:sperm motility kinase-like [Perognathus longimembris pacificus]|uniref:sperm motility kinase-like n=1 Tax=Perognathus longimembris pacificus TaxID=214514 RepID=UPI0020197C9A|nr:sperm motility kinase-like [Perognathus longimembris pacificus]